MEKADDEARWQSLRESRLAQWLSAPTLHQSLSEETRFELSSWFERKTYHILLLPTLLLIFFIFVFPILFTVWMSFHDITITRINDPPFIGLENYVRTFAGGRLFNSIVVTFYNLAIVISGAMILGLILALIYHEKFWGRGVARTLSVIPMMATPAALALIMKTMYHPTAGVFNYLLSLLGLEPYLWTYAADSVVPAVGLIQVYQYSPLVMLFVLGGLAALPHEPYEAATVDGATWWQRFRFLTLPLIRPHLLVAGLILTIDIMKQFDIIFIMTGGGPGTASETMNLLLYKKAFSYFLWGEASAFGLLFLLLMLVVTSIFLRYRRRQGW